MARATLALCLALAVCVAAEVQIKTLQEDNSQPGVSSGTYAIVQDGQVVGMVQRYSSEAPIRRAFGRRSGPSDDGPLPPHAQRLIDTIKARMDVFGALHDQLAASRCPLARQMAMARLQAAAAAAAADSFMEPPRHPHLVPHPQPSARQGALPEDELPDFVAAREHMFGGEAAAAAHGAHGGLDRGHGHGMMAMHHESKAQHVFMPLPTLPKAVAAEAEGVEDARPAGMLKMLQDPEAFEEMGTAEVAGDKVVAVLTKAVGEDDDMAWAMAERSLEEEEEEAEIFFGQLVAGEEDVEEVASEEWEEVDNEAPADLSDINLQPFFDPIQLVPVDQRLAVLENPAFPRSPDVREALLGSGIAWESLNSAAVMPDGELEPDMSWRFYTDDGDLNWGLVTFVGLVVACAAVWGAMLAQYVGFCSAHCRSDAQSVFITRATTTGSEDGVLKPLLHEGVEHAAAHVAQPKQNVNVLQYEPLK